MSEEQMEVEQVVKLLNEALPLQMRSAALYTWAAGTITGVDLQAVGAKLERFGALELDDARRLIEKVVTLGGTPTTEIAGFEHFSMDASGLRKIVGMEKEANEALRAVIPPTGQEARSEAMEHLLEHLIMRKQEQIDFIDRVLQGSSSTT